jgi:glycosyltransferase involved in cell wall biosynthesis
MKVLVFTSLYPNKIEPNLGVFIKERMVHFAKLDGCQMKVVAPVPYFPPFKINWRWKFSQIPEMEVRDGVEVYHPRYLMTPKVGMCLYGALMFASVLRAVGKIRRDFEFDLIDAHFVYPDGFAALLLGRFFKTPVVVSARGSDINLYAGFPIIRRALQYVLKNADGVIAVCGALKEAIMRLNIDADKVTVIPNGVDAEKFRPVPRSAARAELGLPVDKRILLSVGGLVPRKGFDLLIKALRGVMDRAGADDLYLVIVGEGAERKKLETLAADVGLSKSVRFAGSVAHKDLHLWYSAADVFCLASSREGWPNVVLEAMACGTPVVATNVWGTPEIIRSDRVGLLTERTEAAIADAISRSLEKDWRAEEISRYARQHTWSNAARAVRQVFESVLSRGRFVARTAGAPHGAQVSS